MERETIDLPGETAAQPTGTVVARRSQKLMEAWRFIRFKRRAMVLIKEPHPHYIPLRKEQFETLAYQLWGGLTRSQVSDMYAYVCSVAPDMSANEHLVCFGVSLLEYPIEADTDISFLTNNPPSVWSTRDLSWQRDLTVDDCVWRSPHPKMPVPDGARLKFIMDLAGGDEGLYDDIMQSIAPLVMERKPDGVIWWVGNGANGKSTLMDAIYRVFPGALASITVKRLMDGRDTPSLNGQLGNIVKESSEGRVDDTEIYKALGTHENFRVHRFHSQDDLEIDGNLHTIFSANSIPSFNDKGYSARRRTFIIPFNQVFESNPGFEAQVFTPEFFGQFISELCRYAKQIAAQGYRYKWSAKTLAAKAEYDAEASCAEEYAASIVREGVIAFQSYNQVRMDYENWCAEEGYPPLGIGNLRKAMTALGFERVTKREGDRYGKAYRLRNIGDVPLMQLNITRPGLFTTDGYAPSVVKPEPEPPLVQGSILNHKW
jgi:hypothetical protein